jgi:hypothetical protein
VKRMMLIAAMLAATTAIAVEDFTTATVLDSATKVTGGLTGTGYKTILVENGGSAAIYCSKNASVTVDDGHKVGGSDGFRSFPAEGPIYCIAASSQSGTGRDQVIVWGSYK